MWSDTGRKFNSIHAARVLQKSTELQTLRSSGYESATEDPECVWNLIGVKMQMVEAVEEEIPAHQETEHMLETDPVPPVGNMARWMDMDSCEEEILALAKRKVKTCQGKDSQVPRVKETARVGTLW